MENNNIKIPLRFFKEVTTHVVSNLLAEKKPQKFKSNVPLILGIHGKSGEGKSFQIKRVLFNLGFKVFHISGSQLESENAGEPADLIVKTYLDAGKYLREKSQGAAIVIDDIDAGFGNWGELFQYTVNLQIVVATLMHLADSPKKVKNNPATRIPIIFTGNDFKKIYKPLSRPGRMRSFDWTPTLNEKIEILGPVFPILDNYELNELITRFSEKPISFFIDLSSSILHKKVWDLFKTHKKVLIQKILENHVPKISYHCLLSDLIEVGERINFHSNFKDHLKNN